MAEMLSTNTVDTGPTVDPRDTHVRAMLLAVLRSLVDTPESIELLHISGADGIAFQVRCAAGDIGKLIGKSGRTARAIRTILSGSAAKNGRRYSLDIAQQEPGPATRP